MRQVTSTFILLLCQKYVTETSRIYFGRGHSREGMGTGTPLFIAVGV